MTTVERLIPLSDGPFFEHEFKLKVKCARESRTDAMNLILEYMCAGTLGRPVLDIDWVELQDAQGNLGFRPQLEIFSAH